jgi:hypothetical protein
LDSVRLIAIHDILNERINRVAEEQKRVELIEGPQGKPGKDGKDGKDGSDGRHGRDGTDGKDGVDGKDGIDGISVVDASVDVDGHLTITLSNGDEIDAGDLTLFLGNDRIEVRSSVGGGSSSSDLDLTSNAITATFVAGEALTAGDCCHLDSNGEMVKSDATNASKSFSMLALATTNMSLSQTGTFLIKGMFSVSGFTAGDTLFLSTSPGSLTPISPNGSGNINRVAGYATSSTRIFFDPDKTWMEIN